MIRAANGRYACRLRPKHMDMGRQRDAKLGAVEWIMVAMDHIYRNPFHSQTVKGIQEAARAEMLELSYISPLMTIKSTCWSMAS